MNLEEIITARIAELETERVNFVAQANATVQAYDVTIAELRKLIAPVDKQSE